MELTAQQKTMHQNVAKVSHDSRWVREDSSVGSRNMEGGRRQRVLILGAIAGMDSGSCAFGRHP